MYQSEKMTEMQLVQPTEVCGKYKVKEMASLFLSNVINADHKNSCLFTNKGRFPSPLWVFIGVLAKFHV